MYQVSRTPAISMCMMSMSGGGLPAGDMTDEKPGKKEATNLAGHFLRGHAGSIAFTLAMECGATWQKTLCVERAGHTIASFKRNYCRGVVPRLRVAFESHKRKRELRFEEAARL